MNPVLNISAYLFVSLNDTAALRESIRSQAATRGLRGTVILATEGINLFLAGGHESVRGFLQWLRGDARFESLAAKESESDSVPFARLLVKVKPEIIRMNHPTIRPHHEPAHAPAQAPANARAPALAAATLARWLDAGHDDAGRPVVMLDTRNAFEVGHGHFEHAVDWNIARFSDFPAAALEHRAALEGSTVVTYCTGGIRCEKAALFMREAGIADVWQLDGGILQYFETVGARHFVGDCFVFDARETVDATLQAVPANV